MAAKYLDFVANAGRFASFLTLLVKFAKKYELTDEEFAKLATDDGEPLIEAFVLSLKTPKQATQSSPSKPVSHIVRRMTVPVDRETPLEVQLAELAQQGKIQSDWWKELTSEHYPSDKSRPSMITLGECHFNKFFQNGDAVKEAVKSEQGVIRNGDPYEFCAWLRHEPQAGLEYSIVAFDKLWLHPTNRHWSAPFACVLIGERNVHGFWVDNFWDTFWRFLVVCESE